MEILITDIPDEGLHFSGEISEKIFALADDDPIQPRGQIHYQADIYALTEVVLFSGKLRGPFSLQCGICLEYFPYEADYPEWSSELDLEEGQKSFNLHDVIREDLLLQLPAHPCCEDYLEDHTCPRAHLLSEDEDAAEADEPEMPESGSSAWNVLDDLK